MLTVLSTLRTEAHHSLNCLATVLSAEDMALSESPQMKLSRFLREVMEGLAKGDQTRA